MFTGPPRFEHLLVNSALLLLVGLPLEMTHGCGRVALVFVPGPFLYYISQKEQWCSKCGCQRAIFVYRCAACLPCLLTVEALWVFGRISKCRTFTRLQNLVFVTKKYFDFDLFLRLVVLLGCMPSPRPTWPPSSSTGARIPSF